MATSHCYIFKREKELLLCVSTAYIIITHVLHKVIRCYHSFIYLYNNIISLAELHDDQLLNMEAAHVAGLPDGEPFTLGNFSYSNSVVVQRMFQHLNSSDFLGISVSYT